MAVSLQSLKIGAEKIEQIESTLAALDEATTLIAAFTQTEENQVLLSKLLDNIDSVKAIVGSVDLMETTTEDINKGTYLGNRKIDIDVALNKIGIAETTTFDAAMAIWSDTTNTVYYDKATCVFVDGTVIEVPFVNDDPTPLSINVSTHGDIKDQLLKNTAFATKLENTNIIEDVGGRTATVLRITDITGTSSNVERVELHTVTGNYVDVTPKYFWALTTSALQTLANRVGDIIALGNNIDNIIVLSSRIDEMLALQGALTELEAIYNNLTAVLAAEGYAQTATTQAGIATTKAAEASASATSASNSIALTQASETNAKTSEDNAKASELASATSASTATTQAGIATTQATNITDSANAASLSETNAANSATAAASSEASVSADATTATQQATIATTKANEASASADSASADATTATTQASIATQKNTEMKDLSVENTTTGAAGSLANVIYDSVNNAFTFVVPQGDKGDRGDAFAVNSVGHTADRALYDDKLQGFSFLDLDASTIYFKLSNTSGDWSNGAPFGKGETGATGATGNGIVNVVFTSTTDASGNPAQSGATDTYTITYTDTTTSTFTVHNGLDSAVLSVAGRTGDVVLAKADVGLGSVDNTADTDKPISAATQTALDSKADSSQVLTDVPAGAVFTDTVYDDTALQSTVAAKADKTQDASTSTKYTDATSALNYKLYVDSGNIIMEEL